jgi:hypothetical protein
MTGFGTELPTSALLVPALSGVDLPDPRIAVDAWS